MLATDLDVESECLKKFHIDLDPEAAESICFHLCLQGLKNSSLLFNVAVSGLYMISTFLVNITYTLLSQGCKGQMAQNKRHCWRGHIVQYEI